MPKPAVPERACKHPKKKIGVWMPNARGTIEVHYCDLCEKGYTPRYLAMDRAIEEHASG
jgi:hypothetical protein